MINIAIDGPAGSGKSTIAKNVSKIMDILYLDTGAMYRAVALKCAYLNIDCNDESNVCKIIDDINLQIEYKNATQVTLLDGVDVSREIRQAEISMNAAKVSKHKCVRLKMVDMQRQIASSCSCVLDGRDIGSFVLPNSKFKYFLTALAETRCERRYKQMIEQGQTVDFNKLLQEINERDKSDSNRSFSPLKKQDDALEIDTSNLSIEEVTNIIVESVKNKLNQGIN